MVNREIERITKLNPDEQGVFRPEMMYRRKGRKKGSKMLSPFEKAVRHMARAQHSFSESYLSRHERSKKKKDGWLRDFGMNVLRASGKASKQLRFT